MFNKRWQRYALALVLPAAVTVAAIPAHDYLSTPNVSLLYIVAVVVTAVNTSTRPALLSAFVSFLGFNLVFTEPRGTLFVMHTEDVLTIGLFLLTALLVGHLSARQREQVELLRRREQFNAIQYGMMEKLAVAINRRHVVAALDEALGQMGLRFSILAVVDGELKADGIPPDSGDLLDKVRQTLQSRRSDSGGDGDRLTWSLTEGDQMALPLSDGREVVSVLSVRHGPKTDLNRDLVRILVNQVNLALGRTRLVADLEKEQVEKEQEVMRSALLSSVSHDFRTPLTSMVGATSTLLELSDTLTDEQKQELLNSVLSEARRLNDYTQKLLDMTRLGRGELKLNRTTVTIEEILNVVLKRVKPQAETHAIRVRVEPDLPPLVVHAALIEQAIYNVLENALKFSPSGSPVEMACRRDDAELIIDIEDEGPGIPVEERQKVFEMFHSADRGDRRAAGSGLGLAICKGMIGAHGGGVSIHGGSRGTGSRVRITLPLVEGN